MPDIGTIDNDLIAFAMKPSSIDKAIKLGIGTMKKSHSNFRELRRCYNLGHFCFAVFLGYFNIIILLF